MVVRTYPGPTRNPHTYRRSWPSRMRMTGERTMTAIDARTGTLGEAGFLDRERTIAQPGFNRWLVPPAALCIHLCIGMSYGLSVFWLPLTRAIGITKSNTCTDD